MSKKTRKKSSKPSTGKAIRAQSATSAKKAATKSSTNTKNRQTGKANRESIAQGPIEKVKIGKPGQISAAGYLRTEGGRRKAGCG